MNPLACSRSRFHLPGIFVVVLALALSSVGLYAQVTILRVNPQQTDSAIESVHGPHVAVYDRHAASAHRLFVFFVGTGAKAETSLPVTSAFASWGYHAIALDYENNVLAVSCAHSLDSACFDHYRENIVAGAPVSDKVSVDPANSILNRLQKLLVYLVKNDPAGGWSEFVGNGKPVWSHIVLAGHSQGSGHAAYIAKLFEVDRVLIFSGPQDYLDDFDKPAPWQSRPSATPPSRFYAFLNWNDPFNVHHQIANCMALMDLSKPETQMVEPGAVIAGDSHILITNIETTRAHGSTLFPQFENVWEYMSSTRASDAALKP